MVIVGAVAALLVARSWIARGRERARDRDHRGAPRELTSARRYSPQRLRILVVDDNPVISEMVARLLDGHEVSAAIGGEAALSTLTLDDRFDAILVALAMRGMSGAAFEAALAERHPDLHPHIVFLVNGALPPDTHAWLERSDVPWVTKPLAYAELATCVCAAAVHRPCAVIPSRTLTPVRSASG